jgi:hypothetical protein
MNGRICALTVAVIAVLSRPTPAADAIVRVMSFNVWTAEDTPAGRQRILDTIRQSEADIVGLQEMDLGPLQEIAASLGYRTFNQALGSEMILTRYRTLAIAPNRYGALVELAPGHEAWIFNTHLFHAPYGPYQLNGIAYFGGRIYDPSMQSSITSVVADQIAARGTEMQGVLASASTTGALANGGVFDRRL